jgi:LysM domain
MSCGRCAKLERHPLARLYDESRKRMTNPTRVVALLIAAFLSGCAVCATFDLATAGPASAVSPAAVSPAAVANEAIKPRGRAYLFRGFAGMVFSRGTDQLAERIERAGFAATVNEAVMCSNIAKEAIRDYRRDPAPVILIGHSVGGACALSFAERLQEEDIPVSLLVTTEPARISNNVPPNVGRYINIFQSDSVLGGIEVAPAKGYQGYYASFDLVKHKEISHVNMEKAGPIQDQVMSKILALAAPSLITVESEPVPIHNVVPADAPIELWDGGMPVFVRLGDTLPTLAARYRVPLWSLAQINSMPGETPLAPGQGVIVPRYLVPPAAPNSAGAYGTAPSKR